METIAGKKEKQETKSSFLHSLEKPIEWKRTVIETELVLTSPLLHSLEKPIEWKLERILLPRTNKPLSPLAEKPIDTNSQ